MDFQFLLKRLIIQFIAIVLLSLGGALFGTPYLGMLIGMPIVVIGAILIGRNVWYLIDYNTPYPVLTKSILVTGVIIFAISVLDASLVGTSWILSLQRDSSYEWNVFRILFWLIGPILLALGTQLSGQKAWKQNILFLLIWMMVFPIIFFLIFWFSEGGLEFTD